MTHSGLKFIVNFYIPLSGTVLASSVQLLATGGYGLLFQQPPEPLPPEPFLSIPPYMPCSTGRDEHFIALIFQFRHSYSLSTSEWTQPFSLVYYVCWPIGTYHCCYPSTSDQLIFGVSEDHCHFALGYLKLLQHRLWWKLELGWRKPHCCESRGHIQL